MKNILSYFLPVSPFLVELISDYVMIHIKNKPDWFRLKHRVVMILAAVLILIILGFNTWQEIVKAIALAFTPYCFFDYPLNKLRKKKWYYLSTTNSKWWDENLHRVNPYALLTARIVVACVLLGLIIWL